MFFAHSENLQGKKHLLRDHLASTAALARTFAPNKELADLFHLAGLLHDTGKYQNGFQNYLKYGKPKTPHAGIGAFIARLLVKEYLPLPFAIKGHHAGMPDKEELASTLEILADDVNNIHEVKRYFLESFPDIEKLFSEAKSLDLKDRLFFDCVTRFLFSALTDADWLDTEQHFTPQRSDARTTLELEYETLLAALEKKFAGLPIEGPINILRTKARNEARIQYNSPQGFFSLQLPTGLGKTLTSVHWALLHARHHQLKRIIIVLPYINIIDQTALILKDLFGENAVLEHHTGIIDDDEEYAKETFKESPELAKRLACENWDAPIILTTSVQFFESLFSNRPFKCRKNHNIAESVVIFDEVQTLPKQYAEPIIVMLKDIAELSRTSFLFCTATQPAFKRREGFEGIDSILPLIAKPRKYFEATKRVDYKLMNSLKEVPFDLVVRKFSKEADSFLAIVNTKAIAKELYRHVSRFEKQDHYYHLSTAMCPHHRKETISQIVADLDPKKRKSIAVISTQLVEAGVDFDFPCVYRAIGPLDAIIQAAGRCNRNGRIKKGRVVLFNLEHQKMPDKTYKAATDLALRMIKDDPELLHRAESFEQYYEAFTSLFVNTDKYDITSNRKNGNFKTVAENFRLIDTPTVSLLIQNYSEESNKLTTEVINSSFLRRDQLRRMQQYSVQVYNNFLMKYSNQIEHFNNTLYIWHGVYDANLGIMPEDAEMVF